tara:strand:+ start:1490 stop:1720 length:231 start_codon:yes stop_codon:yes gene_type:complete
LQLFFTGVFGYLDSQAFGLAALFGMIKDLNLFTIVSIDPLVTSTNKFSWCASIPAFGSVIVRILSRRSAILKLVTD